MKDRCLSPPLVVLLALLGCLCITGSALAGPVAYLDAFGEIYVIDHPKAVDAVSALSVLSSPPPGTPLAGILSSAVPRGTRLLDFRIEGDRAVVNFSKRLVAEGVAETRLAGVFEQVKWTLWNWGIDMDVVIQVEGTPFAEWAEPTPLIEPRGDVSLNGLGGHSITLSPGHGKYWNGSSWVTARPVYCSPLNQEDYHNLEICQYLQTYLVQDSMTVRMARCTDKNYGNSPYAGGEAWWRMGACYWLKNLGYPCSVYGSYSGCTMGSGADESSDDIRARPLASDYDGSNIYISMHTNGYAGNCYGGSCPTGTITYYDCGTEHASWCTVSTNLANAVHDELINTIRNRISIPGWTNRGKSNSNGAYGEIRIPDRAAILIELAFHDSCDTDAVQLRDNFFRSASAWGIYKGICNYFGDAATWDFYSDELVSHDIPTQMNAGEVRTVHITFRNRGVLWTEARQIRLGAVGDSDPFTGTTRQNISGEVGPNTTYQFTFNLTAPGTAGSYVTDWRMVRDGVTWFGATCSQTIQVLSSDSQPPSVPTNLSATVKSATRVDLAWTASTDNVGVTGYKVYRNGGQIATSATTSYSDTTCAASTSYTYTVAAYDAVGNTSAQSSPAYATTPPSQIIIDNPACELSGVWSTGTSSTDKYGADYNFASTAVEEGKTATWRPNFGFGGVYDAYAWWPVGTNRALDAPYNVAWSGGSQVVEVNQQVSGGQWNLLLSGKTFAMGTDGYIRLSNGTGQAGYVVVADAVRWVTVSVDTVPPSVPTNPAATPVSCTQVNLSWTASTDNVAVGGYKVYRNGAQIGTATGTSYSDTNCSPSTTYSYKVSAYDTAGNESAQSTQVTATTPADTTAPSVPTNLDATAASGTQVDLTWTASTDNVGVTGYKVFRNGGQIATSAGTSYSDTTCSPGQTYTYEVSAYDAASNESAKSTPDIVTTPGGDTQAPSVPTNLAANAVSGTQVDLTWTASTDNVGVTGYKVFRNSVQIGTSATASYSDTTCTPATSYTYEVSAYDAASNESAKSAPATVTTPDTIAPSMPTGLSANAVSETQVNLSWTASTDNVGVTGYKVYRNGGQIGTSATTTYSDTTCSAATSYTYEVSAYDAASNESAKSAPATATTPDTTAPSVPTGLLANAVSGTQVNLAWTASTDNVGVTGYKVFRNSVQIGTSATISFSDTNCIPATSYTYEVSAYDAASNESAKSAPATVTTPDTIAPSVPTNLSANAVSGTQVDLSWTASTDNVGVTGYKVFRNSAQIGTSATTSFSDTACTPATTYTYEVSAYDAASNESAKSAPATATTPDTIAPSVPTNLSANAVSGTQVDLSWTASTDNVGVTGYKVFRNGVQIGTSATASYSDTTCSPATSYTYEVSAYDAASNESAKSAPDTVTTPDTIPPSAPTDLVGNAVSGTQVNLSWTASTDNVGVTGYRIYRNGGQIGTSATTSYSDTTCTPSVTYTYQVSAIDAALNESGLSNSAVVTTPDTSPPSTPTNLQASAISQTRIDLTWTASTDNIGVTGYKIFRNGGQIATSVGPSYSDTTCQSYTTYTYQVSAYDGSANESGLSNQATATTPAYTDIIMDNNLASYVGTWFTGTSATDKYGADYRYATTDVTDTRTATWTPDIDIAGYYDVRCWYPQGSNRSSAAPYTIYWDGGSQMVAVNQKTNGGQWNTLVTAKRFLAGTSGYIRLANGTGESALNIMADAVRFLLVSDDITPPSVPSNVSATGVSASQINVSWTASTDNVGVTGYKIFRNGGQIATTASTSYSDTGLSELTTYTYEVSAYDAMGNESAKSSPVTGTTLDGTPPSTPTGLSANAVAPTRISLSWTASTDNVGVTGYKVFRNGGQIGTSASTAYTDTSCSPSTSYTYEVSAYDAVGNESGHSNQASATTPAYANIIIDNPAATFTGVWTTSTSGTDRYGADYQYASTAVTEGKTATWTPNMTYSGYYDIYAWWSAGTNRATNAPYTVYWDGGSQVVSVNQSTNGGAWRSLLTNKHHIAGTTQRVKLGNGTGATGKVVVADAVRWQQIGGD